jgi:hypothetical protein
MGKESTRQTVEQICTCDGKVIYDSKQVRSHASEYVVAFLLVYGRVSLALQVNPPALKVIRQALCLPYKRCVIENRS